MCTSVDSGWSIYVDSDFWSQLMVMFCFVLCTPFDFYSLNDTCPFTVNSPIKAPGVEEKP